MSEVVASSLYLTMFSVEQSIMLGLLETIHLSGLVHSSAVKRVFAESAISNRKHWHVRDPLSGRGNSFGPINFCHNSIWITDDSTLLQHWIPHLNCY